MGKFVVLGYTLDELISLYNQPLFIVYAVLVVTSCIFLYAFVKKIERMLRRHGASSKKYKYFSKVNQSIRIISNHTCSKYVTF